jgi:hypothetical protein
MLHLSQKPPEPEPEPEPETTVAEVVEGSRWTLPTDPEHPEAPKCVQQKIDNQVSTCNDRVWSPWTDWGVDAVWDDGRTRTGHDTHGTDGDRDFACIVVGERAITEGDCAPKVSVLMGGETDKPEFDPVVEQVTTDCLPGDIEVSVTTTTFAAVWDPEGPSWDREVDEGTVEQETRPLNQQEQAACGATQPQGEA